MFFLEKTCFRLGLCCSSQQKRHACVEKYITIMLF